MYTNGRYKVFEPISGFLYTNGQTKVFEYVPIYWFTQFKR